MAHSRTAVASGRTPSGNIFAAYIAWIDGACQGKRVDNYPYFCKYRNMESVTSKKRAEQVAKYADMFSAMGTEPRLRVMQLLLSAHPKGLVVGELQGELEIPNSTLSHHLDKLKNEGL